MLKVLPWDKVDIEVVMVELEHAGKVIFRFWQTSWNVLFHICDSGFHYPCFYLLFQVFPGSRRDVHVFMLEKGFDYVGSLFEDDLFIKKDLNTPERYPINVCTGSFFAWFRPLLGVTSALQCTLKLKLHILLLNRFTFAFLVGILSSSINFWGGTSQKSTL